jgi:phosphatidylglycerophosphate synthase
MTPSDANRRPIAARDSSWARVLAARIARTRITPNQISLASVAFAALGSTALIWRPGDFSYLLCALCIQLRLLCNLLDGMVAVEGGKGSPLGRIYNEFPDRITDTLFIVALGYAAQLPWLGWCGALAAVGTAYVRVFGGAVGLTQDFRGPVAKQQRMALATVALLAAIAEARWHAEPYALQIASALIAAGSLVTCATRTRAIARQLLQQG